MSKKLKSETIDVTIVVRSRWVVQEDALDVRDACLESLAHYFSADNEYGIFEDFGCDAWGGYRGPRIIEVVVEERSAELSAR